MTTRFDQLLPLLAGADARFIIVGGFAATLHGAARLTLDLDLIYARDRDNLTRLVGALARLDKLLQVKNAAGRAKDFEAMAELLALREGAPPLPPAAATSGDTPGAPA